MVKFEFVRLVELFRSLGSSGLKVFSVFCDVLCDVMFCGLVWSLVIMVLVFLLKLVGSLLFIWCLNLVVSFG